MPENQSLIPTERIERSILLVRGQKVMLDNDLASLYGVGTKGLIQAVKRNLQRFPEDFMFQLSAEESEAIRSRVVTASKEAERNSSQSLMSARGGKSLRSQFVISKGKGGRRYRPYAFTEQGVAMLSSVLRSPRAVEVNIAIMRTFVQLRRLMDSNRDLARRIEALESRYDEQFATVFDTIKRLIADDESRKARPKRNIGFLP